MRGTARVLAHLGFEALATTSMGFAFSTGNLDNTVDRDRVIGHVASVASSTDLPVSADLENGFGDAPEMAAENYSALLRLQWSSRRLNRRRNRAR